MMMMPLALKPTTILRGNKLSETAMSSKGYLDVPLTIEVDPNLRGAHQYPDTIQEDIQCPPAISTLRQWGQTKIPSRKHAGKSFERSSRRPGVRSSDLEQACSLSLAPKFPDVLPDETACRPRSNIHDSGDHSEADADQLREASRSCDGSTEVRDQDN
jgi:hypothetical protein